MVLIPGAGQQDHRHFGNSSLVRVRTTHRLFNLALYFDTNTCALDFVARKTPSRMTKSGI